MDEFSDFQMAVQLPKTSVVSVGAPPTPFAKNQMPQLPPPLGTGFIPVGRLPPESPVRDRGLEYSSLKPILSSCMNKGASVGSRLANYDLGLSGPQVQSNGFQNKVDAIRSATMASNFADYSKTINNSFSNHHRQQQQQPLEPSLPPPRSNPDLLIGEEDRYSALRMLVEKDLISMLEKPPPNQGPCCTAMQNQLKSETVKPRPALQISNRNVSPNNPPVNTNTTTSSTALFEISSLNCNTSKVVNSSFNNQNNLMGVFPTFPTTSQPTTIPASNGITPFSTAPEATDDDFGDFGDFQSFTGFTSNTSTTTPSASTNNTSSSSSNSIGNFHPQSFLQSTITPLTYSSVLTLTTPDPVKLNLHGSVISPLPSPTLMQNGTFQSKQDDDDEGDTEFGDFVSVEPVIPHQPQTSLPPVPPPAPLPTTSQWNKHFDLAPMTLLQQTPPPLPPTSQEDKENIQDILDIGGYFSKFSTPLENDLTPVASKSQPEPAIERKEILEIDDDFDTFTSFTSTPNYNNDNAMKSSDQEKVADCSIVSPIPNNFCANNTPSTSNFIRTSLIRNDKVTDIDPIKWNQSVEESNNDCTIMDYGSFDRKDFSSSGGGKSKFLDVSPETRSIASLDLGNYVTSDYSETNSTNNNNNNNSLYNPVTPIQSSYQNNNGSKSCPSTMSGAQIFGKIPADEQNIYDEFDKYQCFREECENEKERYYSEWNRCLLACKEMISKALAAFNGVSTSEVIREVVADEKGYSYVLNILEVYRIFQRIQKSAVRLGIQSKLEGVSVEITNLWETLSAFLLGTCVSTEICQENLDIDDCFLDGTSSPDDPSACGVCLCIVNTSESNQCLDYGGKIYHCKCANFWVNEVDSILPSLSYVSNLNSSSIGGTSTAGSDLFDKATTSLV